ncbi:transcriptional regulator, XRE family with cupin sensor [Cribrihabitans marinus]|uniref:Transcriptional regulator, XRE family with cupin sensor n=1 Tax=Cribrihabitans marinus TaxID=1227549 RepID=A0A1H6QEG5_9RHOB|nr:XRE family transcriptional regulator [Cribrihabitans marinus]GGH18279.1 XRE family transcriptional regulator [Cribrihabitans marinus]SEI40276.1 transcriptional regulator, XRE family with cupin sensor [Cribrihabitans marinus]
MPPTAGNKRLTRDEGVATFGAEVRELRKARQMTLANLAEASGVSISHLSAIERGTVNPTLGKITRIAEALGVPEEWFFSFRPGSGALERRYVVRSGHRRNLNLLYGETVEEAGYSDALLSSSIGGGFHMGLSDYPPYSEAVMDELYSREGEQHGFVLEGELVLRLEDEEITVRAGDSFSFPGEVLHSTRNKSAHPARLIWANSPVIIPKYAVLDKTESTPEQAARTKKSGT